VKQVGNVSVLHFDHPGELTAFEAPHFQEAAERALAGTKNAVVDLGALHFVDSSGLAALVGLNRLLSGRGGDFRLAAPNRDVRAVFELARLHRLFEIHDTVEAAVASFAGEA